MKVDITIPQIGESITEGLLAAWSVPDGEAVAEGQAVCELETDKTTINLTAPASGVLSISVAAGTDVNINQVVGSVDTEAAPPSEPQTAAAPEAAERVTPAAKAMAAEKNVGVKELAGSGRKGLVTKEDVAAVAAGQTKPSPRRGAAPAPFGSAEPEEDEFRKPLSRIRKAIAANLTRTQEELVLLTTFNEADMSGIKSMRARFGESFREKHGVKLGFMSFFLKACSAALASHPEINAIIDGDDVLYRRNIHISVAVSTAKGLLTPVVRNVQTKSLAVIESEIIGFARRASEKTLLPDELLGGTFTVTNGGVFGSMMSTPLTAPRQSAILGMHAITDRPVAVNGEVHIRPMMYLALSYDHRLVDGREAVGFLKSVKEAVESPERLLLEL